MLVQIRLAIGVVLQLQGPDGGQAWRAEIDEESMQDGLRADDECDLLIEEVMGFPMDLFAREEQSCQPRQGFGFGPLGESFISTPWPGRATSGFERFRVAERGFGLLAPWIPRSETATFTEGKDFEDVLAKGIVVYLDTELSRELKEWKDFKELGWMSAFRLDNLGVGGFAVSTLVNSNLATWVSAVDRFAVNALAVDVHAVGNLAIGILALEVRAVDILAVGVRTVKILAIGFLAAANLTHCSLPVGDFTVDILPLHRPSLDSFLPHRGGFQSNPRKFGSDDMIVKQTRQEVEVEVDDEERWLERLDTVLQRSNCEYETEIRHKYKRLVAEMISQMAVVNRDNVFLPRSIEARVARTVLMPFICE